MPRGQTQHQHGLTDTSEYAVWTAIKSKCSSRDNYWYPKYGGAGITLHPGWATDFREFIGAVGWKPGPGYCLRRLDPKGNFEPGNLLWVAPKQRCTPASEDARPRASKKLRLVGQVLENLTVIALVPYYNSQRKKYQYLARVRCVCGNELDLETRSLGKVTSCGSCPLANTYQEIRANYWRSIQTCARRRNLEVTIGLGELWSLFESQKRKCAVTGVPLQFSGPGGRTASLDRIDSTRGYNVDNIQWVHRTINMMRNILPMGEFVGWCRKVASNHPLT